MTYIKTKSTFVRYENYGGVYILNQENQNKTKISDPDDAYLFWLAASGRYSGNSPKIQEWLNKAYIQKISKYELFEKEFLAKPKNYTSTPLLTTLAITSKCNFHCQHCGNNSGFKSKDELTYLEIIQLISEFKELKIMKLALTGGEPLLKEKFFEILEFAAKDIPRITITSNGSLISRVVAKQLKKSGASAIKISLDGLEKFHDQNRNFQGAYQKAIQAITNLQKENLEVRVQSTLMRKNSEDILRLMPILAALKIKIHYIVPVSPIGRANPEMMLEPKEYKNYLIRVKNQAQTIHSQTKFHIRPAFDLEFKNKIETLSTKYKCEALTTTLEITSFGEVIPCSFLSKPIGNIRKQSLQEIWRAPKTQNVRRAFAAITANAKCKNCPSKNRCGGGCLANSYPIYKNLKHCDIYCWKNKETKCIKV